MKNRFGSFQLLLDGSTFLLLLISIRIDVWFTSRVQRGNKKLFPQVGLFDMKFFFSSSSSSVYTKVRKGSPFLFPFALFFFSSFDSAINQMRLVLKKTIESRNDFMSSNCKKHVEIDCTIKVKLVRSGASHICYDYVRRKTCVDSFLK